MRLSLGTLGSVLLAAPVLADYLSVFEYCLATGCSYDGIWYNASGESWHFDASSGCRPPYVTNVREVCMDQELGRAHYITDGGERRCFARTSHEFKDCNGQQVGATCVDMRFDETPCTWPGRV